VTEAVGHEVRRASDGELVGFVRSDGRRWDALAIFGGHLGSHATEKAARERLLADGLAAVARRWFLRRRGKREWHVIVLQDVRPGVARGVVGLYALPDAEQVTVTADDLAGGDEMTLEPPPGMEGFATR
jgi:hypothetical protein